MEASKMTRRDANASLLAGAVLAAGPAFAAEETKTMSFATATE